MTRIARAGFGSERKIKKSRLYAGIFFHPDELFAEGGAVWRFCNAFCAAMNKVLYAVVRLFTGLRALTPESGGWVDAEWINERNAMVPPLARCFRKI